MSIVPNKIAERIQWLEAHVAAFTTNASQIGILPAEATDFSARTAALRAAFDARELAQKEAEAKTLIMRAADDAASALASALIKKIRARAETGGGAAVYAAALIPEPPIPKPVGAPGEPSGFGVKLQANGALEVTWKCANPTRSSGTIYQVYRRTTPAGEFAFLGGTGQKRFVDATLPAGASQVTYQIQAARSTAAGPWAQFNVNIGAAGAGGATATVTPAKLAA